MGHQQCAQCSRHKSPCIDVTAPALSALSVSALSFLVYLGPAGIHLFLELGALDTLRAKASHRILILSQSTLEVPRLFQLFACVTDVFVRRASQGSWDATLLLRATDVHSVRATHPP